MLVHIIGQRAGQQTHDLPPVHKYVKINYRLPGGKCLKTAFITAVFVSLFSSDPVAGLSLYEKTCV
jgi:hypothetical protein